MKLKGISFLIIFMLLISTMSTIYSNDYDLGIYKKKVLVIQSYSWDYVHTRELNTGIEEVLKNQKDRINVRYEFLDSKNYWNQEYMEKIYKTMKEKYENEKFDGIILCDNDALNFYLSYGSNVFKGNPPTVATGINSINSIPSDLKGITVVEELPNYKKTIDVALKQNSNKNIKKLHFIYDDTTTSRDVKKDMDILLKKDYSNYEFADYYDKTPMELKEIVDKSIDEDLFFFVLYSRSIEGKPFLFDEVPRYALTNAKNPVYALWEFYINSGVLGGHLASSKKYGITAAKSLLDRWEGKELPKIIRENGDNQGYIFDYVVAQKYRIKYFPLGSKMINKPLSYIEQNKYIIIFFSTIIGVLGLIIVLLVRVIRQKHFIQKKNDEIGKLNQDIIETQKDIIARLGDVIETRSHETANHVKRVSKISGFLGEKYGLPEEEILILETVSPMHDVGKIGITEEILHKPAKLTREEFEIMKYHTQIGYEILKNTEKDILKFASIVALEHHERWDGTGYPKGKKENEIHVFGRITALADVYDALCSDRVYKKAWTKEDALEYVISERGLFFEPKLVDIFVENIEAIDKIREDCSDGNLQETSHIYVILKKLYEEYRTYD